MTIDELIDKNLRLIYEGSDIFMITDMVDEKGNYPDPYSRLVRSMCSKGLISLEPTHRERVYIEEFGIEVSENGGWLNHLKNQQHNKSIDESSKTVNQTIIITGDNENVQLNQSEGSNITSKNDNKPNKPDNIKGLMIKIIIGVTIGLIVATISYYLYGSPV